MFETKAQHPQAMHRIVEDGLRRVSEILCSIRQGLREISGLAGDKPARIARVAPSSQPCCGARREILLRVRIREESTMSEIRDNVSKFYGETVQKTGDLDYGACCVADYDPALSAKLTDEVLDKRYGCGSPIPQLLEGRTVVDLGSGAGVDCFIASQLVGPGGRVIGVDMTEEQLEIARRNIDPHMERFGYDEPNVEFRKGIIEDLPIDDGVADVVISNCVINLSDDKASVFEEMRRILKPGGEFYISDIVADRRIPAHIREDEKLWGECLAGAAYDQDLRRLMEDAGFADVRTVKSTGPTDVVEGIRFYSEVLRGFAIDLEDRCEDYGQVAIYGGTIPDHETAYEFDESHRFVAGEAVRVCRNTADMLTESRFAPHFEVSEPLSHLGLFDCGPVDETDETVETPVEVPSEDTGSGCC